MKKITGILLFTVFGTANTFATDFSIKKGEFLYEVRKSLLLSGWQPLVTNVKMEDGSLRKSIGDAKKINSTGIIEIEACSGAGVPYCTFNYIKASNCLQVVTIGEYGKLDNSLSVHHWKPIDCNSLSIEK